MSLMLPVELKTKHKGLSLLCKLLVPSIHHNGDEQRQTYTKSSDNQGCLHRYNEKMSVDIKGQKCAISRIYMKIKGKKKRSRTPQMQPPHPKFGKL